MAEHNKEQLPPWLTTEQLTKLTGFSKHFFKIRRGQSHPEREKLPFIHIGRAVRYKRSDVETWMANQGQSSASEAQ